MDESQECKHFHFSAKVEVSRLKRNEEDEVHGYQADVRIWCLDCQTPFQFVGLMMGLDMQGAAMSVDQTEARLTIKPPEPDMLKLICEGAPFPGAGMERTWKCQECGGTFREHIDVRHAVWLVGSPREKKDVCAVCHKRLTREQRIAMEVK